MAGKVRKMIHKATVVGEVVMNDLKVQKHPSDVLSKGVHGALRQNNLSRAPIATLKSANALFEHSKSALHIQPKFLRFPLVSTFFPPPQTDSSSENHSHHKKLLRPWSRRKSAECQSEEKRKSLNPVLEER